MKCDLMDVCQAIPFSKATLSPTSAEHLFWAFSLCPGIPVAAGALCLPGRAAVKSHDRGLGHVLKLRLQLKHAAEAY